MNGIVLKTTGLGKTYKEVAAILLIYSVLSVVLGLRSFARLDI